MSDQASVEIVGGQIVIKLPLNKDPQPSVSGKTLVVATTHGNLTSAAIVNGKPVIVGVNCYIRR